MRGRPQMSSVAARHYYRVCLDAAVGTDRLSRSPTASTRPAPQGRFISPRTREGSANGRFWRRRITLRAVHRLLVLYPPPTDPDHFRSYYEDTHLPLAAKFPGLRGYRYSFDVAAAEGESPYFCAFEADFDDAAAYSAAMASPRVRRRARTSRNTPPAAPSCSTTSFAPAEPPGWTTARTATGPSASAGGDRPGKRTATRLRFRWKEQPCERHRVGRSSNARDQSAS